MSEENLREQLEIDTKLELIKEHKCCAESILCIETYMYCLEQENQQLKEQLKQRDAVIKEVREMIDIHNKLEQELGGTIKFNLVKLSHILNKNKDNF